MIDDSDRSQHRMDTGLRNSSEGGKGALRHDPRRAMIDMIEAMGGPTGSRKNGLGTGTTASHSMSRGLCRAR